MAEYTRQPIRFICLGMDLNVVIDLEKDRFKYPILKNSRFHQAGRIEARVGLTNINTVITNQTPVHSIVRLNNPLNSTWTLLVGTGSNVAYGTTAFTQINNDGTFGAGTALDVGSNPLTFVTYRPDQSPDSWVYFAGTKYRKFTWNGSTAKLREVGLPAPDAPATLFKQRPYLLVVDSTDDFTTQTNWAVTINGSASGTAADLPIINTTIRETYYDDFGTTSTGWCHIVPTAAITDNYVPGMLIRLGGAEDVMVEELFPGVEMTGRYTSAASAITISRIRYESGVVADHYIAWVVFSTTADLRIDSLVINATRSQHGRILSIAKGPDDLVVARIATQGSNWAATDNIYIPRCLRCYTTGNRVAGATLVNEGIQLTNSASAATTITFSRTITRDLSILATGIDVNENDEMGLLVRVSKYSRLTNGKIMLDVDASTNDFTKNYFYREFGPNDLTPVTDDILTGLQNQIRALNNSLLNTRNELKPINPIRREDMEHVRNLIREREERRRVIEETGTGAAQWSLIRFRIRDLVKVGSDKTRTLKNVAALRIQFVLTGDTASPSVTVGMDSWWIRGGAAPDVGKIGAPYVYRYRWRDSTTGARGNWAPVCRDETMNVRRTAVGVSVSKPTISTSDVDTVDIARFGGALPAWRYIGSTKNIAVALSSVTNATPISVTTASAHGLSTGDTVSLVGVLGCTAANGVWKITVTGATTFTLDGSVGNGAYSAGSGTLQPGFIDDLSDSYLINNTVDGNTNFQPWAITDTPKTGTVSQVIGTMVVDSGNNFNVNWAPGTLFHLDGVPYTLYRVHTTATLELFEPAGNTATALKWDVYEPILLAQPLPIVIGPYEGFVFGLGDTSNPGRLYFSYGNNPDSTSDTNWIEVTSPSEPLMNGVVFNQRLMLWSSDRMFIVHPTFDDALTPFRAEEIPSSKGLAFRYAITAGPAVWFVGKDGIYETTGGSPQCISDPDLRPFFQQDGYAEQTVNGMAPPNTGSNVTAYHRLCYADDRLFYIFPTANSAANPVNRCLVYNVSVGGWESYDTHTPELACLYYEEGDQARRLLAGGRDATTGRLYNVAGTSDNGTAYSWQVRTPFFAAGDTRAQKRWGDYIAEYDTGAQNLVLQGFYDRGATSDTATTVTPTAGTRARSTVDILSGGGRLAYDMALDISSSINGASPILYLWEPSWLVRPEDVYLRMTDYTDAGYAGSKKFRGVVIEYELASGTKDLVVDIDGNNITTLTLNITGRKCKQAFQFAETTGFEVRLEPGNATVPLKIYGYEWVYDKEPENLPFPTDWFNADIGRKYLYGVIVEADTENVARQIDVQYDDETGTASGAARHDGRQVTATLRDATRTANGRSVLVYDFTTPVLCHIMRISPASGANMRIYNTKWMYDPWPEKGQFIYDYSDIGYPGAKDIQGFTIEADTTADPNASPVVADTINFSLHYDGTESGGTIQTFAVTHAGRRKTSFALNPTIRAHMVRLIPDNPVTVFDIDWVYNRVPENVTAWITQGTSHGIRGYQHVRAAYIALQSTATVTLTVTVDGTAYTYSIASTGGAYQKIYVPMQAVKGKLFSYSLTSSANFRVFKGDCEVYVKAWDSPSGYAIVNPFGGPHFDSGATI